MSFLGRQAELDLLNQYVTSQGARFIALYGRRRVGKSRLVSEFIKGRESYTFVGLAPEKGVTAKTQRAEFQRKLTECGVPAKGLSDWADIFTLLSRLGEKDEKVVIFLDEISWMAKGDSTFLPKLKTAWDTLLKPRNIMLIVCGSVSSWIEKNLLSSTGFVGRIDHVIALKELPLDVCNQFWGGKPISAYEKFKVLSVTGGIPLYLEAFNLASSFDDNLKRLCFTSGGLLLREFDAIFSDLFGNKALTYKSIVEFLVAGAKTTKEISQALKWEQSGTVSEYCHDLCTAGFLQRDTPWSMQTNLPRKMVRYRLSDNYSRFYCRYLSALKGRIEAQEVGKSSVKLPNLESVFGFQFENLVLNNRSFIWEKLNIDPGDIVCDGPYFQTQTKRRAGCQVDYLIQTRFNNLYICEIKFSKENVGSQVVGEVCNKMQNLEVPRNFSLHPVLIHVGGVTGALIENDFFAKIINMSDAL